MSVRGRTSIGPVALHLNAAVPCCDELSSRHEHPLPTPWYRVVMRETPRAEPTLVSVLSRGRTDMNAPEIYWPSNSSAWVHEPGRY
jgi:hypothetical protein